MWGFLTAVFEFLQKIGESRRLKNHGRTTLFRKCGSLLIEYLSWGTNRWFLWKISKNQLPQTVGTDFNQKDWTAVVLPLLAVVVLVVSFYVFLSPPKVGLVAGRKLVWKCNLVTFVCFFLGGWAVCCNWAYLLVESACFTFVYVWRERKLYRSFSTMQEQPHVGILADTFYM